MKSVLLFLSLHISVATLAQEKADRPYRGMAIYAEVGGASAGVTLNLDKVLFSISKKWYGSARAGFASYPIEQGRVRFLSLPVGINIFKAQLRGHQKEFGLNLTYCVGNSYHIITYDEIVVSRALLFVPTVGYRFQKPGSSLFFKIQYSPISKVKEFEDHYLIDQRYGKLIHMGGISAGYFFGNGRAR